MPSKEENKSHSPEENTPALATPLPALNDPEGDRVPEGLPPVIDAHVHLFPEALFGAIWQWFDRFGWPVRYKLPSEVIIDFYARHGVAHLVALQYAHKSGVARELNRYMAALCTRHPMVTGLATVYPGESGAVRTLEAAFEDGLAGVKLHAHVQCFELDSPAMHDIYATCTAHGKPLVMHAGREPKSPAYPCDPYAICSAEKVERVLKDYPSLKVCVPHLGADEFEAFAQLQERHDNLWLDTTMALADYLPLPNLPPLTRYRMDRTLYGTDFPQIPYAWDRELKKIAGMGLDAEDLERFLWKNACELFGIDLGG